MRSFWITRSDGTVMRFVVYYWNKKYILITINLLIQNRVSLSDFVFYKRKFVKDKIVSRT